MKLIVISLLAVASMSLVDGGAPSTALKEPAAAAATVGEIWQEDDREVLIRNVRGAKNNKDAQTGSASGKKGANGGAGKNRKHHQQHNGRARGAGGGAQKERPAGGGHKRGKQQDQNTSTHAHDQTQSRKIQRFS